MPQATNPNNAEPAFPQIVVHRKTGGERFLADGAPLPFSLLDFWRWSVSDLVSNITRGRLAEFIVARALGISTDGVRDEWAAYDLITPGELKVEVKSAASIQSWAHHKLSPIKFLTPKTRAFDPATGRVAVKPQRQADLYVFAILAHAVQATVDPLNVSQWQFYVLPTTTLDERTRSQHSITLTTLERICGAPVDYHSLRELVRTHEATLPRR